MAFFMFGGVAANLAVGKLGRVAGLAITGDGDSAKCSFDLGRNLLSCHVDATESAH